jgi:hypothetical protein
MPLQSEQSSKNNPYRNDDDGDDDIDDKSRVMKIANDLTGTLKCQIKTKFW